MTTNFQTTGGDSTFSRLSAAPGCLSFSTETRARARGALRELAQATKGGWAHELRHSRRHKGCRRFVGVEPQATRGGNVVLSYKAYELWLALRARVEAEEGQALVEYALILALIAVVSIVVLQLMGLNISRVFGNVNNQLSAVGT
jgi:pilus assembly protein Flp/PilA